MRLHGIPDSGLRRIAQAYEPYHEPFERYEANLPTHTLMPTETGQDRDKIERIVEKMEEAGEWPEDMPPLQVNEYEDGARMILDGHHRWKAAINVGLPEVPCTGYLVEGIFPG